MALPKASVDVEDSNDGVTYPVAPSIPTAVDEPVFTAPLPQPRLLYRDDWQVPVTPDAIFPTKTAEQPQVPGAGVVASPLAPPAVPAAEILPTTTPADKQPPDKAPFNFADFTQAPNSIAQGLGDIKRQEIATGEQLYGSVFSGIERDQRRTEDAFNASRASINDLPGEWNADEQSAKYRTDPIQAFGSIGSVFGIIAAAFTSRPMENALNASAAAINSVKAGDERAYERAYDAWKKNTDLVIRRHGMMHEAYQDSLSLMTSNMAAGQAKLRMNAQRFGDQKTLFLMDNGLDEDVIKLFDARSKMVDGMVKAVDDTDRYGLRVAMVENDPRWKVTAEQEPDALKRAVGRLQAFQLAYGLADKARTPEMEVLAKWIYENPNATAEDTAQFAQKYGLINKYAAGRLGNPNTKNAQIAELTAKYENDPNHPAYGKHDEAYAAAAKFVQNANKPDPNRQTNDNATADTWAKAQAADPDSPWYENYDGAFDERLRQLKAAKATPLSGNKVVEIQSHIDQLDRARELIANNKAILTKYVGAAGMSGQLRAGAERLQNVFGSNQTDRVQFERNLAELKLLGPRLLLDQRTGRPLAAENAQIDKIIAGRGWGDLTANTIRGMNEIDATFAKTRGHWAERIKEQRVVPKTEGTPPESSRRVTPPAPADGNAPWKNDPIKTPAPRSEVQPMGSSASLNAGDVVEQPAEIQAGSETEFMHDRRREERPMFSKAMDQVRKRLDVTNADMDQDPAMMKDEERLRSVDRLLESLIRREHDELRRTGLEKLRTLMTNPDARRVGDAFNDLGQ